MTKNNNIKLLGSIIPFLFIAFFLFYGPKSSSANRVNPDAQETRESIDSLSSKIMKNSDSSSTREVKTGDRINVQYKGWLASNGEVFDESYSRGEDGFTFTVGEGVIEGWSEGVLGMKQGEIKRLYIPSDKGYGASGSGPIPPNADLIFDVELVKFED